jgi:hypothetical protein
VLVLVDDQYSLVLLWSSRTKDQLVGLNFSLQASTPATVVGGAARIGDSQLFEPNYAKPLFKRSLVWDWESRFEREGQGRDPLPTRCSFLSSYRLRPVYSGQDLCTVAMMLTSDGKKMSGWA